MKKGTTSNARPRARGDWLRGWLLSLAMVSCAAVVLLSSGCAAFKPSDSLSVLCSNDRDVCEAWARDFTAHSGIAVRMERLPTSQALARLSQVKNESEFDVWHGGPAEFYAEAARDSLLEPYAAVGAQAIPEPFRAKDAQWTGVYASLLAVCSNTEVLDRLGIAAPQSWEEVLNPALRDWVSTSSPVTSGTATTTMAFHLARLGESQGKAYLRGLYDQVLQFTRSGTAPARAVGQGKAAVAVTFAPYCAAEKAAGQPVTVVVPEGDAGFEIGAVAVLRGSRHAELARQYVDYAVSAAGQQAGRSSGIEQLPTRADLPGNLAQTLQQRGQAIPDRLVERSRNRAELLRWYRGEFGLDG